MRGLVRPLSKARTNWSPENLPRNNSALCAKSIFLNSALLKSERSVFSLKCGDYVVRKPRKRGKMLHEGGTCTQAVFRGERRMSLLTDQTGHRFTEEKQWFPPNRWQFERRVSHLGGTPCQILEVGCFEGQGTCWLLENAATHPEARITCIDIQLQPVFWSNISASGGTGKVELKVGKSHDVLPHLRRQFFDFIFIDGSHLALDVLEDAVFSFPLAKVGAIIGFDDYKWKLGPDRPQPAVDAILSIYKSKIAVLAKNYQVWLRKIED
ncbi:MAG: class I SAM-dependent methyltransferase [Methylovirgula sp.]